jgi:hypothetical protein
VLNKKGLGKKYNDAPASSLMDSTANPKVKTTKGEIVECVPWFVALWGVQGCVRTLGWGLGGLTSNSITHMDLHKPNNNLVSA